MIRMKEKKIKSSITVFLILSMVFVMFPFIAYADEIEWELDVELEESPTRTSVVDIDLGDYQSRMQIGTSQLLFITILPFDATEQVVSFTSSNTVVATINMLGRITAHSIGQTVISVVVDGIIREFVLNVVAVPVVVDIDTGDFQSEMQIGTSQVLMPTLLPLNVPETPIIITSSDTNIATVNLMGRITAWNVGRTTITISAGDVVKELSLNVVAPPAPVRVNNIEISNFKDEIAIGETVEINATPLPADAEEQRVTYSSSNPRIATVNSSGKIEGISAGTVNIIIRADGYIKSMQLIVKEPTSGIDINNSFVVMVVGETFALDVRVRPVNADQDVSFQSYSPDIVAVSDDGILTAKQTGSASVLVSTWDISRVVNIIVNEAPADVSVSDGVGDEIDDIDIPIQNYSSLITSLQQLPENGELIIDGQLHPLINAEVLRELFGTNRTLIVNFPNYLIRIVGSDIRNANNELLTEVAFTETEKGMEFLINEGRPLPGKVSIELFGFRRYEFLYLFNNSSERYEHINRSTLGDNVFSISYNGRYIVSTSRISYNNVNWLIIGVLAVVLVTVGSVAYITVKKKHWFW